MTPEVETYIQQQQAKVRVEPYDDVVFNKTFKGRTRGMWAGAALGAISGVALGAIAWPLIAVAIETTVAFSSMAMATTAIGAGIGIVAGGLMGASAAAAASAAAERERRDKREGLREKLLHTPGIEYIAHDAAKHPEAVDVSQLASPNTLEELRNRPTNLTERFGQLVNFKAMAVSIGLGGLLGAAIGGLGGKWGGLLDLGIEGVGANMLAGALLVGTMASMFGINYPVIFTSLADTCGKILSGKAFERAPTKAPGKQVAAEENTLAAAVLPADLPVIEQSSIACDITTRGKSFASKGVVSYSQMVLDQQAASQNPSLPLH